MPLSLCTHSSRGLSNSGPTPMANGCTTGSHGVEASRAIVSPELINAPFLINTSHVINSKHTRPLPRISHLVNGIGIGV